MATADGRTADDVSNLRELAERGKGDGPMLAESGISKRAQRLAATYRQLGDALDALELREMRALLAALGPARTCETLGGVSADELELACVPGGAPAAVLARIRAALSLRRAR